MKRIIDGKAYNTETATRLCDLSSPSPGDFSWHDTSLYQTRAGAFFLAGEGGARSMWGRKVDQNTWGPGVGIRPLSADEARDYLEGEGETEVIERVFGDMPEAGAGERSVVLRLPEALHRQAAEAAERAGMSFAAYAMRCLERGL